MLSKEVKLTYDTCYMAWVNILRNPLSSAKEMDILESLIKEHFENPPLKFEELEDEQWIWDNKEKLYLKSCNNYETKEHGKGIRVQIGFDLVRFQFEENRFYRKQVK